MFLLIIAGTQGFAQNVGIRQGTTEPDASALLHIDFTDRGFLIPRMTYAERLAIVSPAIGLWVYQRSGTGSPGFYYYTSNGWLLHNEPSQWTTSTNNIYFHTGKVGIGSTTVPAYPLTVRAAQNPLYLSGVQQGAGSDSVLAVANGIVKKYIYTPGTPENAWEPVGNAFQSSTYNGGSYVGNIDANPLRVRTNNIQRMVLDASNGGVGFGLNPSFDGTNPERLLVDVGITTTVGSVNATAFYNAINVRGYINNKLRVNVHNGYSGDNASSNIRATANDGDATNYFVNLGINSSGYNSGVMGGPNDSHLYNKGEDLLIGNGTPLKKLKFITGGTSENDNTRMIIDSIGNVGIGTKTTYVDGNTTYSLGRLAIDGSADTTQNTALFVTGGTNGILQFNLKNTGNSNGNKTSSDIVATADNGDDESLYINMGINGSSYASGGNQLLNGSALAYFYANARDMYIGNGGASYPLIFFTTRTADNAEFGTEKMRITAEGNVCIGTGTPYVDNSTTPADTAKLTVNGDIRVSTTTYSSDKRLKNNIQPLEYGLKEILALEPTKYNWIDTTQTRQTQLGLIAQDTKAIIPEIVSGDGDRGMMGIDYSKLIPVLINAFKTQQQQIRELEEQDKEEALLIQRLNERVEKNRLKNSRTEKAGSLTKLLEPN